MLRHFFLLEWKAFFRSASLGKNLGLRILLIFLALYFAASFLMLGIVLYPLLQEYFPGEDSLKLVNRFLLIWLGLELAFRFMLQALPVLDIKPLMLLPVRKRKMVNFVLVKSLYSFFNFLPMLIIIPFGISCIYKGDYPATTMLGWMLAATSLSLCINFLNFIIKKKFTENLSALLPVIGILAVFAALEYFDLLEISRGFGFLMDLIVENPLLSILPLLLVGILYKLNQVNLEKKFYLDAGLQEKQKQASNRGFDWTRRFGEIAPFLQLDLKLIWRNKRPKTTIYLSLFLLGYGLIFYPNEVYHDSPAFFVFVGIFITGIFMINFGQFIPAWDASYYPMIMAQNIPLKQYLASKAGLITFSVIVLTVLTTPYVYFGWNILLINLACALYNMGVNVPVLLYAGSFNKKKIDLDKSPFMNYQGTGAAQWLVSLPLMVLPIFLFWLVNRFLGFQAALALLAGLGVSGLLLRSVLLTRLAGVYQKRKYAMIHGFKQTGE